MTPLGVGTGGPGFQPLQTMDFDVNATSVKKGYGDYLKTLEIELQRGSQRQ
jgi:hypothetical protein